MHNVSIIEKEINNRPFPLRNGHLIFFSPGRNLKHAYKYEYYTSRTKQIKGQSLSHSCQQEIPWQLGSATDYTFNVLNLNSRANSLKKHSLLCQRAHQITPQENRMLSRSPVDSEFAAKKKKTDSNEKQQSFRPKETPLKNPKRR